MNRVDDSVLWRGRVPELSRREPVEASPLTVLPENTATDSVATWWVQGTPGTTYWRGNVPARELPGRVLQLRTSDLKRTPDGGICMPRQRGRTAVWQFPGNATRGILMAAQQAAGFKVMVEVDDNYLLTTTLQEQLMAAGRSDWQRDFDRGEADKHSLAAHRRLCGIADGMIVTTQVLKDAYDGVNGNIRVCRNSIDPLDWPEPEKPDDGVFRVGYAGSSSHVYDSADIARALSWASDQKGVEVLLYGIRKKWLFPHRRAEWTTDLSVYRRSLAQLDVGLCPLRDGDWNDGKSDVKVLEYAMAGAASVVSRRPPYSEWCDTDMALTADTPKEFLKHVKWCVRNQDGVREMAARAKTRILAERTIQREIGAWRAAVA